MHEKSAIIFLLSLYIVQCKSVRQENLSQNNGDKSSLVFVFDTTGSMYDDLRQLKEGAELILDTALVGSSIIEDFVFVPFHDPGVGPATVTHDKQIFKNDLNVIDVHGGRDCPEMSLSGILLALEFSRPKSLVYVFTDATAKDHDKLPAVLDKLQQTQSQVVFVLTGHCGDLTKPSYLAYQKVAAASSGQVFNLNKTSVHNVLEFVRNSLNGRRVSLGASVNPAGYNHTQKIPIDDTLGEVTVSVSGIKPKITVVDPHGTTLTGPPKLVKALDLSEIMIVKVLQPEPGNWSITVGSENEHSVKVVGLSNLTFNHGFSVETPESIGQTSYRPLRGTYNHLLVQLIGPTAHVQLKYAEIVNLNGRTMFEVPFHSFDKAHNVYIGEAFIPPDEMFYIAVNGVDKYGQELRRMGSTAVLAKLPDAPILSNPPEVRAKPHETVVLECKVESLVPVAGMWTHYGTRIQDQVSSLQTTTIKHTISDVSEVNSGTYTCFAKNVAGVSTKDTELVLIVEPPEVTISPDNMTSLSGSDVTISCVVTSYGILSQFQLLFNGTDRYAMDIDIKPSVNGIYTFNKTIQRVTEANQGIYTCAASNKGGQSSHSTYIVIQSKPTVQILGPHTITQNIHTLTQIACKLDHAKKILWKERDSVIKREQVTDSHVSMLTFNVTGDTVLTCVGVRGEYDASDSITINSLIKPQVNIVGPKIISLLREESIQVTCDVTGKPPPRIVWHKETETFLDHMVSSLSPTQYRSVITINDTKDILNRTYFCIGENSAGIGEDSVDVIVRGKMEMVHGFTDKIAEIYSQVELQCVINSYPEPNITWYHNGTVISEKFLTGNNTLLRFDRVDFNNTGEYVCEARNSYETLRVNGTLSLEGFEAPVLFKNPIAKTVRQGSSTLFTCRVLKGIPQPSIKWYFENNTIPNINTSEFLLQNITVNHQGVYQCEALNEFGRDLYEVTLYVQYVFVPEGRKVQAKSGEELVLSCEARGNPRPQVVWYFEGGPMVYNENRYLSSNNDLIIRNVTGDDSGSYSCLATNTIGSKRRYYTVQVYELPSILSTLDPELQVLEGQLVELPCPRVGIPTPNVTWTHNGEEVDYQRIDLDEDGIRFVANLTDFGEYTCLVQNEFGNVSMKYYLRVWVPPSIQPPLKSSINALLGTNVSFNCDVIGFPVPVVLWEFQGTLLTENTTDLSFNETGNLFISNVHLNHEGVYACVAENIAGESRKYINLNVQEPPKMIADNDTEKYLATNLDSMVVIPCRATGKPRPYVLWAKGDIYLNNDEHYNTSLDGTLTILRPNQENSGEYTCVVRNIHGTVNKTVSVQIYSVPRNIQSEQSRTVIKAIEGTNVSIPCPSKTLYDTVKWYKDAKLISTDLLNISAVSRYNESSYACVLTNAVYSTYNLIDLVVEWPPKFVDNDVNNTIEIIKEDDVSLECDNDAKPLARIRWYFNSSLIQGEDRVRLKLSSVEMKQAGVYLCTADNEHGSVTRRFHIQVLVPPFISEFDFLDVELKEGINATLQCSPSGYPVPKVKWTFSNNNWTLINGSLTANITLNSEGVFRCDATNRAGRTHIVYRVNVTKEAKITDVVIFENGQSVTVDKKINVTLGTRIRLACYVTGRPLPKIQWLRNGKILAENNEINGEILYADLVINKVQSAHSGEYVCMSYNALGGDERRVIFSVLEPPRIIKNTDTPTNFTKIEVLIGQMFHLHCHPIGNPSPSIYWFKDGVSLRFFDDTMTSSEFGEVISSSKALVEQAGNYTCVARNDVGTSSVVYTVDVLVPPPPLKENHKSITGRVSKTLNLACPVDGIPTPVVTWIKLPYTELNDSSRIKISEDNFRLIITDPKPTDTGNYTCIMTNKVGTTEYTFNVTVEKAPSIVGNVGDSNVVKHIVPLKRSIVLKCEVDGYPPPKITWLKNTQPITETSPHIQSIQSSSVYVIWSVEVRHASTYICLAENTAGVAYRRFTVVVKVPGKYGSWSQWSLCNVTCGLGYQKRRRVCQYIDENNSIIDSSTTSDKIELDLTTCEGKSMDQRKCHMPPCEEAETSKWGAWSKWSKCSVSCGEGTQGRTRKCRSRDRCQGDNLQIRKCPGLPKCNVTYEDNSNEAENEVYSRWTESYNPYIPEATFEMTPEVEFVSPDVEEVGSSIGQYFEADLTRNLDNSDRGPCIIGYRYNNTTRLCYDIDECQLTNNQCHPTQTCVNSPGGYKCGCQTGYQALGISQRCLDINECLLGRHMCEFACVNVAGGYLCACPTHLRLHVDRRHCVVPSAYRKPINELTASERWNPSIYL